MDKLTENTSCYAKEVQRNVLLHLSENETGRQEPKDFIDFYFINKMKSLDINAIYSDASQKEGMFDDPPMVAYQVENNLRLIIQTHMRFLIFL